MFVKMPHLDATHDRLERYLDALYKRAASTSAKVPCSQH